MCGLAGVIFGKKRRRAEEREYLAWLFTRLLLSEERGPHATGAAWLDTDGCHRFFKRPVTAERFVTNKAFAELLASMDNRATLLLGHTRRRTRGDEWANSKNHPIRAGEVIGTHNGTIYNAAHLFRRLGLPRYAEVDSEILFRPAANAARDGAMDIKRFRNAPYWRERFGDSAVDKRRFNWTRFYEAVADKLLTFRNRRDELIAGIHVIASKVDGLSNLQDQFADGSSDPLKDICPFTAMGIFNRGITDANRKAIASELAGLLGVSEPVPDSFEGIPIFNNQRSRFFGFDNRRQPDDIDTL